MDTKPEVPLVNTAFQITTPEAAHLEFVYRFSGHVADANPALVAEVPIAHQPIPLSEHMKSVGAQAVGSETPSVTNFATIPPAKENFLQRMFGFLRRKKTPGVVNNAGIDNLSDHAANIAQSVQDIGKGNNEAAMKVVTNPEIPSAIQKQRQQGVELEKAA